MKIKHVVKLSMMALALFLFGAWPPFAHAKQHVAPSPVQGKIDAIESTNAAWTDISADFEQRTDIVILNKTVTKKGTLRLKKGGKMNISYSGDNEKSYVSDGTTLWIYIPGDAYSLETYAVDDKNIPREALTFLGGFGKLRKEFSVSESAAFGPHTAGETALHLEPRSKSTHYRSLDALFGPDNIIKELIIDNVSGNQSHYVLKNVKTNQNPPDDVFTLSAGKAPDVPQ